MNEVDRTILEINRQINQAIYEKNNFIRMLERKRKLRIIKEDEDYLLSSKIGECERKINNLRAQIRNTENKFLRERNLSSDKGFFRR